MLEQLANFRDVPLVVAELVDEAPGDTWNVR
jgi:hypothetical protein